MSIKVSSNCKKGYTHGGVFHADDVFASALLKIVFPNIIIERGFTPPVDDKTIVFDIGGGLYDHHQEDAEVRDNGIPYAAFGLLWRDLGAGLVGEQNASDFDEAFVQSIDECDNSSKLNPMSLSISYMNPEWNSTKDHNVAFDEAVALAKGILENYISKCKSKAEAEAIAQKAIDEATLDGQIAILDRFAPVAKMLEDSNIKYIIYPSLRGGYNVQCINSSDRELKCPLPEDWAGKDREYLSSINPGLSFCHKGRFLAAVDTIETGLWVCTEALSSI